MVPIKRRWRTLCQRKKSLLGRTQGQKRKRGLTAATKAQPFRIKVHEDRHEDFCDLPPKKFANLPFAQQKVKGSISSRREYQKRASEAACCYFNQPGDENIIWA
jgi:hypothetical protein